MLINILKPDYINSDDRGSLVQLVHEGYSQVNTIHSVSGTKRGGHYHKKNLEAFYVIKGSFALKLETVDEKESYEETYEFNTGDMFSIPPFVSHAFDFYTDTQLISMYSKGVELPNGDMDIYS